MEVLVVKLKATCIFRACRRGYASLCPQTARKRWRDILPKPHMHGILIGKSLMLIVILTFFAWLLRLDVHGPRCMDATLIRPRGRPAPLRLEPSIDPPRARLRPPVRRLTPAQPRLLLTRPSHPHLSATRSPASARAAPPTPASPSATTDTVYLLTSSGRTYNGWC